MSQLRYVLTLVLALSATVAHADPKKDRALALFEKSDKAYKDGKFEQAVKLLEEAYGLYPEPLLLYNLGRAQEGLGDIPGAVDSYERYLKDGKQIQDRGAIERRLETLKAQLASRDEEQKRLAEEETRRKKAEEDQKQAEEDRKQAEAERLRLEQAARANARSPLETWGPWITIGTGGALVATGFLFGARASSTHDDAVAAAVQRDAVELQHSAERSATVANVVFVLGGVAIAGGVGWRVWQWRSSEPSATVTTATVRATGSGITIEGTWW
jgi:tetratricopeptide (TPR) repeat protein